ncbi:hypothetical protein [Clostridium felsineum]|uniref:Uncharacterized protein n=1 Tax=Clostridium felsineum TaxID=36839 RepID=A0A1S8LDS2_9CLOT|nr:hypothetical protein [Clostridium felsineum]URZ05912.1 hypothetical protein CLROS_012440 [Clostridium felsineum]URZ10949.1 hypothetical protein CROST_016650 [Clostridium felsineum]
MESLIDNLNDGKKIVVLTYDIDKLKSIGFNGKIKVYDNLKRMYSFKNDLTMVKLHQNNDELNEMEIKILLILFKSASRQKVDYVYIPKGFKIDNHQFDEYKKFIKYIGK